MRIKILIISHNSFSKTYNNGKTLSAIFSAFEIDELCQLFFTPKGAPDFDRCENYYLINDKDALNSILFRTKCGTSIIETKKTSTTSSKKRVKPSVVTRLIRTAVWRCASWYHGGLNKWLTIQKPTAIFYVGGDGVFSHRIAVILSEKLHIPLATYFTDDYVINPPLDCYNWFLRRVYKKTVNRSEKLFAIGVKMADDYTAYYSREFKPIMNIVDIPPKGKWAMQQANHISINYFGGLHLGRAEEIMRFAQFMREKVRNNIKKPYVISIYSFSKLTEEKVVEMKNLGICIHPGITGNDLARAMRNTDILLHVESVRKEFHSLTKLSVSTKLPEYMCLTKPILAFGPADVASFRMIVEANPAMVVDDVKDTIMMDRQAKQIIDVLNSDETLAEIANSNYNYAKAHFDKKIVAEQFRNEITSMMA